MHPSAHPWRCQPLSGGRFAGQSPSASGAPFPLAGGAEPQRRTGQPGSLRRFRPAPEAVAAAAFLQGLAGDRQGAALASGDRCPE